MAAVKGLISSLWEKFALPAGKVEEHGGRSRAEVAAAVSEQDWKDPFAKLAKKWKEVPGTAMGRIVSSDLLKLSDDEVLSVWQKYCDDTSLGLSCFSNRGWYQLIYGDYVKGKRIIEVGSGIGIDGVAFAQRGAKITFVDIVEDNLRAVQRIFKLKGLDAEGFIHLKGLDDIHKLEGNFDAIFAFGSLHHAPAHVIQPELQSLASRLKPGGRFVMHAYPKQRWLDEGSMDFSRWGERTDGEGTPWAEWYDVKKVIDMLRPAVFEKVFYDEYRDGFMNAIDLIKVDGYEPLDESFVLNGADQVAPDFGVDQIYTADWGRPSVVRKLDSGVEVETGPKYGSAAAAAHLPPLVTNAAEEYLIKIDATVQQGRIGLALTDKQGTSVIVERFMYSSPHRQFVRLKTDGIAETNLLIMNADPNNAVGKIVLHKIEIFVRPK